MSTPTPIGSQTGGNNRRSLITLGVTAALSIAGLLFRNQIERALITLTGTVVRTERHMEDQCEPGAWRT